ncbi:MAG: hypothetical protein AB9872_02560 [Solidesulfovibrio sp.]
MISPFFEDTLGQLFAYTIRGTAQGVKPGRTPATAENEEGFINN